MIDKNIVKRQYTKKKQQHIRLFIMTNSKRNKKLIVLIANTQAGATAVRLLRVIAVEKRPILISFQVFEGA